MWIYEYLSTRVALRGHRLGGYVAAATIVAVVSAVKAVLASTPPR